MSKANRVRKVYAELRSALGDEAPAREILRLAHQIVDVADRRVVVDYTRNAGRPETHAVDEMMLRNPWALVEDARGSGFFEDDEFRCGTDRGKLHQIMRMAA